MDTIKVEKKQVKMVAHRGLSGIERENTNAAFIAAGNRSYYGIETDIHKTLDGKFVIMHDDTTERSSCGAVNLRVEEVTYAELKDIVLPDKDGSTVRQDIRIPLLQEYIHICKKYDKKCVLELKQDFDEETLGEIVSIIREQDYLEGVIFISFYLGACVRLRTMLPQQKIQWLSAHEDLAMVKETVINNRLDLDMWYGNTTKELVEELHAHGVEVNCWTCDKKEDAERLIEMGVDYITSNILE